MKTLFLTFALATFAAIGYGYAGKLALQPVADGFAKIAQTAAAR